METLSEKAKKQNEETQKIRDELIAEDPELKALFDHPLNCLQITPELMETPTFQGIQTLIYDGEPEEVAQNFLKAGKDRLQEAHEMEDKEKISVKLLNAMNCL